MTVTRDQAQMLTTLAIACRPHRAPTWDAEGVMAAIGRVKDRALAEVILAVIRAAADREAVSPGVIPSNGSHWQEQLKPERWEPTAGPWCGTCGVAENRHKGRDHEFERIEDRRLPGEQIADVISELRDRLERTTSRPEPSPRPASTNPHVAAARAALGSNDNEESVA